MSRPSRGAARCPACGDTMWRAIFHFCVNCWNKLPDDLRERVQWAQQEQDVELEAALLAAQGYLGAGVN